MSKGGVNGYHSVLMVATLVDVLGIYCLWRFWYTATVFVVILFPSATVCSYFGVMMALFYVFYGLMSVFSQLFTVAMVYSSYCVEYHIWMMSFWNKTTFL